jgi:AraC-like DNA-binding protein
MEPPKSKYPPTETTAAGSATGAATRTPPTADKACRTAKELAVLCGYNDTVFTQLFKKNFHGDTPYQWLQKQTSYEIEFKLKKSTLPIKQIMLDYHFKTFSHFTTYCKRNIGATPNEIRKKGEESRDTPSLETYSVSAND